MKEQRPEPGIFIDNSREKIPNEIGVGKFIKDIPLATIYPKTPEGQDDGSNYIKFIKDKPLATIYPKTPEGQDDGSNYINIMDNIMDNSQESLPLSPEKQQDDGSIT